MICLAFEKYVWGCKYLLHEDKNYKIIRIELNAACSLVKQYHEKRSETLTIVEGEAFVSLNDEHFLVHAGECVHIPVGVIHTVENKISKKLIFIETQTGTYIGEDDLKIVDGF